MTRKSIFYVAVIFVLSFLMLTAIDIAKHSFNRSIINGIVDSSIIVNENCGGVLISDYAPLYGVLSAYHCVGSLIDSGNLVVSIKKYTQLSDGLTQDDEYKAAIIKHDQKKDLVLLAFMSVHFKGAASTLLPKRMNVNAGDHIYTVGNPEGLSNTLNAGIVSHPSRHIDPSQGFRKSTWSDTSPVKHIQFSAGTWRGNSGGGLYNNNGYLIGIVSMIAVVNPVPFSDLFMYPQYVSVPHLAFATHIDSIREFLNAK